MAAFRLKGAGPTGAGMPVNDWDGTDDVEPATVVVVIVVVVVDDDDEIVFFGRGRMDGGI
jgi:hypothetical protein